MHPGFFGWLRDRHHHFGHEGFGPEGSDFQHHGGPESCGPRGRHRHHEREEALRAWFGARAGGHDFDGEGGGFGVRRPLRFLAHKLELEEDQVTKLAAILDELKTDRAQASVDHRRTVGSFADAVTSGEFDEVKAREAGEARVKSAERLRDAVVQALGKLHALLDAEQRNKLAYLLRTGALAI